MKKVISLDRVGPKFEVSRFDTIKSSKIEHFNHITMTFNPKF
jgi:hypothetical protein